jgi:hypothetical protein
MLFRINKNFLTAYDYRVGIENAIRNFRSSGNYEEYIYFYLMDLDGTPLVNNPIKIKLIHFFTREKLQSLLLNPNIKFKVNPIYSSCFDEIKNFNGVFKDENL